MHACMHACAPHSACSLLNFTLIQKLIRNFSRSSVAAIHSKESGRSERCYFGGRWRILVVASFRQAFSNIDFTKFTTSGVNIDNAAKVKLIGKRKGCSKMFPPYGIVITNEYPQH